MNKRVKVGKVSGVHGLKGDVKVTSYSDSEDLLDIFKSKKQLDVFLVSTTNKANSKEMLVKVDSFKKHQSVLLVKFSGVASRNDSEALKGFELEVLRDDLPKPTDGEFYLFDLLGLDVKDSSQGDNVLGKLKDVINAGAGDVYVIETSDDGEILLPANEETILEINVEEGFIKVSIPKGLIIEGQVGEGGS